MEEVSPNHAFFECCSYTAASFSIGGDLWARQPWEWDRTSRHGWTCHEHCVILMLNILKSLATNKAFNAYMLNVLYLKASPTPTRKFSPASVDRQEGLVHAYG